MFRISKYLGLLHTEGETPARSAAMPGPVVIWNLTRRCNLRCKHCYSVSADTTYPGELGTDTILQVLQDLWDAGVRVVILSGGEPLMHKDIFVISEEARRMGFYVALSTNGTLIDAPMAERVAAMEYDYVGISFDGMAETHNRFRGRPTAFEDSRRALRLCNTHGTKTGIRFTLTSENEHDFANILQFLDEEDVQKFYLSHLNYGGRGNINRSKNADFARTRQALGILFEQADRDARAGVDREYVTGNNDADAVFLYYWLQERYPERAEYIRSHLEAWGGNASGINIANIDNLGNVHPDTFWWEYSLGNVAERPFGEIWSDLSDPVLRGLKQKPRPVEGRCGGCSYKHVCGGNSRVRAWQVTGNLWAEDPGCYLTDEEIGVACGDRLAISPFAPGESSKDRAFADYVAGGK